MTDKDRDPAAALGEQLERIEHTLDQVLEQARLTNGRVGDLEQSVGHVSEDLYGPAEDRRRASEPGLLARFADVRAYVLDQQAATKNLGEWRDAKRWIVGTAIGMGTLLSGVLGLLVQLARSM